MMCGLASTLTDRAGTVAWLNPGWASCFNGALQLMLKQGGVKVEQTPEVEVTMSLNKGDDGLFLTATITATVFGVDQATADAYVHKAHQFCPYSKAFRNNVEVTVSAHAT